MKMMTEAARNRLVALLNNLLAAQTDYVQAKDFNEALDARSQRKQIFTAIIEFVDSRVQVVE